LPGWGLERKPTFRIWLWKKTTAEFFLLLLFSKTMRGLCCVLRDGFVRLQDTNKVN